jgi:predicted nucleic acid-binding protein
MAGPVVSDAGPLMALAKLNLLHLLKRLYGQVHFPHSVYEEAVVEGLRQGFEDAHTLKLFLIQEGWEAVEVKDMPDELASLHLDRGELDSLALALATSALLLIDEARGREEARRYQVRVRGTLGVLIEAYRRGFITSNQLRFYFSQIEKRTDIWISSSLCRRLLQQVLGSEG